MDVKIINPFLAAAVNVLQTMAKVDPEPGKPYLRKSPLALGDVSAVVGISGAAHGTMALSFSESCILAVVSGLFQETVSDFDDEVKDAVGELANMICGDARRRLDELGMTLRAGIPTVVSGKEHAVDHPDGGPRLVVPFHTPHGDFVVEVSLKS